MELDHRHKIHVPDKLHYGSYLPKSAFWGSIKIREHLKSFQGATLTWEWSCILCKTSERVWARVDSWKINEHIQWITVIVLTDAPVGLMTEAPCNVMLVSFLGGLGFRPAVFP